MSNKYKQLKPQVKASFWFLICSILQKGISVITTPIFTRLLTTSEYGQFNVFNSWMGIIAIFVTLRLSYGVYSQGLVKFESDQKRYSSSMQGLNLVLCVVGLIVYLLFKDFFNSLFSLTTIQMIAMLTLIWADAVFEFWAAEQRVTYSYKHLVILTILVSIAKPLVGIFLVTHCEDKVTARIIGLVIVELAGYTALFFIQMFNGKCFYSKKYWRYAISFNLPLIPHYLSQTILNSTDRIMIKNMVGSSEAGIYSLAYSLALMMTLISTALMSTLSPWIYQKIKAKHIEDISNIAYITLVLFAACNIFLIAVAPEIVKIFAPSSYYDAIYIIPPVAMSAYFMYCYDLFARFEFYFEKTTSITIASIIGAATNIFLNYIFINEFGYIAAGYTTLVCYMIYALMHYKFMSTICDQYCGGIQVYDKRILSKITIMFLLIGFLYLFTYDYLFLRLSLTILLVVFVIIKRDLIKEKIGIMFSIRNNR